MFISMLDLTIANSTLGTSALIRLKGASHCPEIDRIWTHENEASHDLSGICWHAKDLPSDHELETRALEIELVVI